MGSRPEQAGGGAGSAPGAEAPLVHLGRALALSALGPAALALGALGPGTCDAVTYLAWLAVLAPAAGYLAAALGVGLWPYGLAVPGVWLVALVVVEGRAPGLLPKPFFGALVVAGLFAGGAALGDLWGRGAAPSRGFAGAGVLLLLAALMAGLASRGGAPGAPLEPRAARLLLDLSPATLALESAGVDWMRDPAVYDPAATDRFQRRPYRGVLAGPLALLVGCLAAALARALIRGARAGRDPSQ